MRKYFQFIRNSYYFPHWDETPLSLYTIRTHILGTHILGTHILGAHIIDKILSKLDKVIGYEMLKRCRYYL